MIAAPATFEFVRRGMAAAVQLIDDVTARPVSAAAEISGLGLAAYAKGRGAFVVTRAQDDPFEISVIPNDAFFAPRRALLRRPPVPLQGQPDPRSAPIRVRLLPGPAYRISGNLTALPCRVRRPGDQRPVALALVRLFSSRGDPAVESVAAAAITNIMGEALLVIAGAPLVVSGAAQPTRRSSYRLEVLASREPVSPAPGARPVGRAVATPQAEAEARFRAGRCWPQHLLDPDSLTAAAAADVVKAGRDVELVGGSRNDLATLEIEVPD